MWSQPYSLPVKTQGIILISVMDLRILRQAQGAKVHNGWMASQPSSASWNMKVSVKSPLRRGQVDTFFIFGLAAVKTLSKGFLM
jgi:hypothetical protein